MCLVIWCMHFSGIFLKCQHYYSLKEAKLARDPILELSVHNSKVLFYLFFFLIYKHLIHVPQYLDLCSGHKFPVLKEADAMFSSEKAPEWKDGETCTRCRVQFGMVQRKVRNILYYLNSVYFSNKILKCIFYLCFVTLKIFIAYEQITLLFLKERKIFACIVHNVKKCHFFLTLCQITWFYRDQLISHLNFIS